MVLATDGVGDGGGLTSAGLDDVTGSVLGTGVGVGDELLAIELLESGPDGVPVAVVPVVQPPRASADSPAKIKSTDRRGIGPGCHANR